MDVKETLRALDEDVSRLLLAGGSMAGTDDALNARKDALASFAAKVPALARVAEQVGKVTGAKPRAATGELLTLSAMVWQLRGAQSQPAKKDGGVADPPATVRLETPLAAHEIEPIYEALTSRGSGRRQRLDDALERGVARDLRLLVPWVAALADRDGEVAQGAAERGVPSLGEAAVPLVTAGLRIEEGGGIDARRLACLVKIQGEKARPLVDRALEKGSVAMRVAGLEALAELKAPDRESIAVGLLKDSRSAEVRAAAAGALAGTKGDAALEALLAALGDADTVARSASAALCAVEHPAVAARLLALLTPEVIDFKPYVPPKPKKGAKITPAQQKAAEKEQREAYQAVQKKVEYVRLVIGALGERKDAAWEAKLIALWKTHPHDAVVSYAGNALVAMRTPAALAAVLEPLVPGAKMDDNKFELGIKAATTLPPEREYELLAPFFADKLINAKGDGADRAESILVELEYPSAEHRFDPRWGDLLLGLSTHKGLRYQALETLGSLKGVPVDVPRAIAMLDDKDLLDAAMTLLGALGDKRATAPLVALLERKGFNDWYQLFSSLRQLDDPAALAPLKAYRDKLNEPPPPPKKGAKKKAASNEPPAWLLRNLEQAITHLDRDRTLS